MISISNADHAKIVRLLRFLAHIEGRDNKTLNTKREAALIARKFTRQLQRLQQLQGELATFPEERKNREPRKSTSRVAVGNDGQRSLFAQEP